MAQMHIRSARILTDAIDIFSSEPRNELLSDQNTVQGSIGSVDSEAGFLSKKYVRDQIIVNKHFNYFKDIFLMMMFT